MSADNSLAQSSNERVLLIDDDRFSLQVMRMTLEKAGLVVEQYSNPEEGLKALRSHGKYHFSCAISDYHMPEMDGVEVIRQIREFDPCLGSVIITAAEEQEIVKDSYRNGAVDFLAKPVNPRDLVQIARDTVQKTQQARKETETVAGVEEAGREGNGVNSPLPESIKQHLEVIYRPRHAIGGDFLLGYEKNEHQFGLLLGDVSGHTMKSALLSSFFQGFMQGHTGSDNNFLHALSNFNNLLYSNNEQTLGNRSSLSLCHFTISRDGHRTEMINCGFSAPVVIDFKGNTKSWPEGTFAIGWFEDIDLFAEEKMTRQDGYLYSATDGLEDHANDIGINQWSLFFFLIHRKNDKKVIDRILANSRDDILGVRYRLNMEAEATPPEIVYDATFPGSAISDIDAIQKKLVDSLSLALGNLFESRRHDIVLCMREAIINALKHGCQAATDQMASMTVFYTPDTQELGLIVSDGGIGHSFNIDDRREDLETDLPGDRHLGLVMMHEIPDTTETQRNGAYVRMCFKLREKTGTQHPHLTPEAILGKKLSFPASS